MGFRLVVLALVLAAACAERAPRPAPRDSAQPSAPATASVRYDHEAFAAEKPLPPLSGNPFKGQERSANEGETLFASMNCDGCHGGGAMGFVGPSLTDGRWRYGGTDARVFESIYSGRPNGMPAFGGVLSPELIWKLVTYLQSLPLPKAVPTQAW